jgi:hypothetical protein
MARRRHRATGTVTSDSRVVGERAGGTPSRSWLRSRRAAAASRTGVRHVSNSHGPATPASGSLGLCPSVYAAAAEQPWTPATSAPSAASLASLASCGVAFRDHERHSGVAAACRIPGARWSLRGLAATKSLPRPAPSSRVAQHSQTPILHAACPS